MLNVLNADLRRYSRTKLIYIGFLVISLLNILSTLLIYQLADSDFLVDIGMGGYYSFIDALTPSNNGGLVIGIIICALVAQEFSYGTIRNKVIVGHRRIDIFISLLLSSVIVATILFVLNTFVNGGFGTLIIGFGKDFNKDVLFELLSIIGLGTFIFLIFIFLGVLLGILIRNTGGSIVAYLVIMLILSITIVIEPLNNNQMVNTILSYHPINQISTLMMDGLSKELVTNILISTPIYYLLIGGLGYYFFKVKDLK